eukprot:TRINITY_DN67544_c4_g1_i1.p1 TRINITY_DN67544_c4_g1~~TRINITY_DN67544_c4_g1_i1.p1  ORF type:complete len:488 (-),score=37.23 TRINITY_DN67544_c4_g1_i1:56-1366(-)
MEECLSLGKLNILLAGRSGVGKSSICNAVFGANNALTGVGAPVSQTTKAYRHPSNPSITVYDTKGIEINTKGEWEDEMNKLVKSKENKIHIVWYVVAGERFEQFEIECCNRVFGPIVPLVILLNKADQLTDETRLKMADYVASQVPAATVHCVAADRKITKKDKCDFCGSCDLIVRSKKATWECEDCEKGGKIQTFPVQPLVDTTVAKLDDYIKESFIGAQVLEFGYRATAAEGLIRTFAGECTGMLRVLWVKKETAHLMARIAHLYNFTNTGKEALDNLVKHSWFDGYGEMLSIVWQDWMADYPLAPWTLAATGIAFFNVLKWRCALPLEELFTELPRIHLDTGSDGHMGHIVHVEINQEHHAKGRETDALLTRLYLEVVRTAQAKRTAHPQWKGADKIWKPLEEGLRSMKYLPDGLVAALRTAEVKSGSPKTHP